MPIRKVFTAGEKPVKVWTEDIDARSQAQLINISRLPFIHKHVAAMANVHRAPRWRGSAWSVAAVQSHSPGGHGRARQRFRPGDAGNGVG